jgi:hypothetical protein
VGVSFLKHAATIRDDFGHEWADEEVEMATDILIQIEAAIEN